MYITFFEFLTRNDVDLKKKLFSESIEMIVRGCFLCIRYVTLTDFLILDKLHFLGYATYSVCFCFFFNSLLDVVC